MISPAVVLGTFKIKDKSTIESMVTHAASKSIRLVDSANLYENEELVMQACDENQLEFGTKIHKKMAHGSTLSHLHNLFTKNGNRPLYRVLLHGPLPIHMWRDLEESLERGFVKQIGICNVDIRTLQCLVEVAKFKPLVVQAEFHPFLENLESTLALVWYCTQNGIIFEAHSVLGGKARIGNETVLSTLAGLLKLTEGQVAQELIKWARLKAPSAVLCLASKHTQRLDELLEAVHMTDLSTVKDLSSILTPFRSYPINPENDLITTIAGIVLPETLEAGQLPDHGLVQRVFDLVCADKAILDLKSNKPFNGIAHHLNKPKDVGTKILITRVALMMFSPETKVELDEKTKIGKVWASQPPIASAVSKLCNLLAQIRREMDNRKQSKSCALVSVKGTDLIDNPVAMPVQVPKDSVLDPFFKWILSLDHQPIQNVQFGRGALLKGGHLDMCKQVVGPAHMSTLCKTIRDCKPGIVEHFLLGNNIAFENPDAVQGPGAFFSSEKSRQDGIEILLEIMDDKYAIKTWYLAGNCIDGNIFKKMARVLAKNGVCESLWLKRNPLGVEGAKAVGYLMARNEKIQVLDLHNCAIGDDGLLAMNEEMKGVTEGIKSALKHFYLGANGLTSKSSKVMAEILGRFDLESVILDMNDLGDEGIKTLSPVLCQMKSLKRLLLCSNNLTDTGLKTVEEIVNNSKDLVLLNVGFYKSSLIMGCPFNNFTDVSPLIRILETHPALKILKSENSILNEKAIDDLEKAVLNSNRVSLYALQQRGYKGRNVFVHGNEEKQEILNPPINAHIYSIYRNNM